LIQERTKYSFVSDEGLLRAMSLIYSRTKIDLGLSIAISCPNPSGESGFAGNEKVSSYLEDDKEKYHRLLRLLVVDSFDA